MASGFYKNSNSDSSQTKPASYLTKTAVVRNFLQGAGFFGAFML